jgi:hypothetical protein
MEGKPEIIASAKVRIDLALPANKGGVDGLQRVREARGTRKIGDWPDGFHAVAFLTSS